jgi:hypothetical protein
MNKAYIVMKKGYEYDDSIYNETEGGTPKIVSPPRPSPRVKSPPCKM